GRRLRFGRTLDIHAVDCTLVTASSGIGAQLRVHDRPRLPAMQFGPLLALLGPQEMSDLSPQSGPKRTLSRHRRMTGRDPELTSPGSKSRSAAPSAGPRCAILSVGSTGTLGSETAQVHHAARRRGGGMAARGARAAARARTTNWRAVKRARRRSRDTGS